MQAQIVKNPGAPQGHTGTRRRFGLDFGTFARIGQTLHVELGVVGVVVACVQIFLNIAQGVTEALEVNDLALTQELDRVANIGVVDQAQQVIVSCARFLLWCMADGTT